MFFLQVHHGVCNALQWTPSSPSCRSVCGKSRNSTSELTCLFDTVGRVNDQYYSMYFALVYIKLQLETSVPPVSELFIPTLSIAGTTLRLDMSRSLSYVRTSAITLTIRTPRIVKLASLEPNANGLILPQDYRHQLHLPSFVQRIVSGEFLPLC